MAYFMMARFNRYKSESDQAFADRTNDIFSEMESKFRDVITQVTYGWGPKQGREVDIWRDTADLDIEDKRSMLDVMEFLRHSVKRPEWSLRISIQASTGVVDVARARWLTDFVDARSGYADEASVSSLTYETACRACGWCNPDEVPNPYSLDKTFARSAPRDIYLAHNGIVILRRPLAELLHSRVGEQITLGNVVSGDASDQEFSWVRPRCSLGDPFGRYFPRLCGTCARPLEEKVDVSLWAHLLERFGSGQCEIARVGAVGRIRDKGDRRLPSIQDVAISGNLFNWLCGEGTRGLAWPVGGICVSVLESEPTWVELENDRGYDGISRLRLRPRMGPTWRVK